LLTAFILVSLFLTFRESLSRFFGYSILASGLIVATFVDIELTEIPDEVSLGCLVLGMIFGFVFPANLGESSHIFGLLASIAGAAAGGLSIYLMGAFGKALFRKEAMGGGDVKLMAMIGSFLGWKLVLLAFFIAPISGAIVGIVLKIRDGQEVIPYGPHLSLAALVTVFWGEKIVRLFGYR
jgi:leader peptidase (prepilin peptidase)/N-methyltransferase